jgi:integrase
MKTDNENNMPLSDKACKIVDRYKAITPKGPMFKQHHSQSASKVLKKVFEDLKLSRPCEVITMQGAKRTKEIVPLHDAISFHMARNTYITRLLSSNVPAAFVQHNVGHSDIKITMGYFRNDDVARWKETLMVLNKN